MIIADSATVIRTVDCSQFAVSVIELFMVMDGVFSVPEYEPVPIPAQPVNVYCVPKLSVVWESTLKIAVEPAAYQPSPTGLP